MNREKPIELLNQCRWWSRSSLVRVTYWR